VIRPRSRARQVTGRRDRTSAEVQGQADRRQPRRPESGPAGPDAARRVAARLAVAGERGCAPGEVSDAEILAWLIVRP
jgi:hypothetical protein